MTADKQTISAVAAGSFKKTEFSCIYAIGPEWGHPLKIGYAADLVKRLKSMQTGNWHKLRVHTALWIPGGADVARPVEQKCHALLQQAGKHICGEWFNITVPWADKVLATASNSVGAKGLSHDDMLRHVKEYRLFVKYPDLFWPNARRFSAAA